MVYAVIDTNVFISALISKNSESATVKVLEAVMCGDIILLYHKDIKGVDIGVRYHEQVSLIFGLIV